MFVPILRAGLGMVDGMLKLVPAARVGHVGMYRDPETFVPHEYYCKLPPNMDQREVIVLDPMLLPAVPPLMRLTQLKSVDVKALNLCVW